MHSKEILRALQAGKISLEEAKKTLIIGEHPASEENLQAREGANEAEQANRYGRKEAIAIVGMSGKYAGTNNLSEYWDNLLAVKNAIRESHPYRWDLADYVATNIAAFGI